MADNIFRDVGCIRRLTDHQIPKLLPSLPKDVNCRKVTTGITQSEIPVAPRKGAGSNHHGEWFWPDHDDSTQYHRETLSQVLERKMSISRNANDPQGSRSDEKARGLCMCKKKEDRPINSIDPPPSDDPNPAVLKMKGNDLKAPGVVSPTQQDASGGEAESKRRELEDKSPKRQASKLQLSDRLFTTFPNQLILYLHGGAFCTCSTYTHRGLIYQLVKDTGATVFAVDYGRPPECPYPGPINDCYESYMWLLERGFDNEHIILAGDSAGGGLVVALLAKLRDEGKPCPAAGVCISPWLDLTPESVESESWKNNYPAYDFLTPDLAMYFASAYAGSQHTLKEVSPGNVVLEGLPPLLLIVGSLECLRDQVEEFAAKAEAAGVDVELHVALDMPHVFPLFGPFASEDSPANTIWEEVMSKFIVRVEENQLEEQMKLHESDDPTPEPELIPSDSSSGPGAIRNIYSQNHIKALQSVHSSIASSTFV